MCIDATGVASDWDMQDAGVDVMAGGTPIPDSVIESFRRTKVALKAPITTPVGTGFRSVNVYLRQALDLYACSPAVQDLWRRADVLLRHPRRPGDRPREHRGPVRRRRVRAGQADGRRADRRDQSGSGSPTGPRIGHLDQADLDYGHRRIVKYAFEYARKHGRKKVTAVHKANILKYTDGLFLEVAREVRQGLPRHRVRGPASSTTCACSSCRSPSCTTCSCCRTSTATSSPTLRRPGRRAGRRPGRQHRRRGGRLRGDPRLGAQVQGPEQDESDGPDPVRRADARASGGVRSRDGWRRPSPG